jgi:hypothetical protein
MQVLRLDSVSTKHEEVSAEIKPHYASRHVVR